MLFREFEGKVHFFTEYKTAVAEAYKRDMAKILADSKNLKLFEEAIRNNTGNGQQYFDGMSESAKNLAEQVGVLAANGKDATSIIDGFADSQKKIARATYQSSAAVKGLSVQLITMFKSMAVMFLVTKALQVIFEISNKLIVTYDELKTKYSEVTSELESVNSELETTKTRLSELEEIPVKNIIEQNEYNALLKTNAELLRRKQTLEAIEKVAKKDTYQAFVKTFSSSANVGSGYIDNNMPFATANLALDKERVSTNLKAIKHDFDMANFYGGKDASGNVRDAALASEYYEKAIKLQQDNNRYMTEASKKYLAMADSIGFVANATEDWELKSNEYLTSIYEFTDATNFLLGETIALGNLLDNTNYSGLKDVVIELIGQGNLTGEALSGDSRFAGLLARLKEQEITADDVAYSFANYFNTLTNGKSAVAGLSQNFSEFNTYIDNLQGSYETLNKAVDEYNKHGSLSIDTVQGILSMNKDYLLMMSFENGLLTINKTKYKELAVAKIASLLVDLETDYNAKIKLIDDERDAVDSLSRKYEELTVNKMLATSDFSRQKKLLEDLIKTINEKGIDFGSESKSNPFDDAKALLDIEKSRLEAGMQSNLSSMSEYYDKLEALVKQYYAVGTKEYRQYELEVFQGRKSMYEQEISLLEHQITLLEKQNSLKAEAGKKDPYYDLSVHNGDNDQQIINKYRDIQEKLHKLANSYREVNETENQNLINALQKQWWDYEDKIQEVYKNMADSVIAYAQKMKQAEQDYIDARLSGISSLSGSLSDAIDEAADMDKIETIFNQFQERINEVDLTIDPTAYEDAQAIMERSLEILTRQAELEKENTDRKEKQLELEKAKQKLENLMNNRKIKVLQKQADGSWDYVYEADLKEVEDAQKEYNDKKKAFDEWELQQNVRHLKDKYDDLVYGLNRESRALEDSMATIESTVATTLDTLKTKFGTDIPIIQGYLTQMIDDIMIKVKSGSGGVNTGIVTSPPSSSPSSSGSIIENLTKISSDTTLEYLENKIKWQEASDAGDTATMAALNKRNSELRAATGILTDVIGTKEAEAMLKKIRGYSTGGMNTTPGLAMLHGTKKEPEVILNESHAAKLWNLLTQPISAVGRSVSDSGLFDKFFASMALQTSGGATYNFNNLKVELPNVKDGDSAAALFDGLSNFAFQYANKR